MSIRSAAFLFSVSFAAPLAAEPRSVSGIYPHLAMFNDEGECGTGAVVPWAGKLWVITYAPHKPQGSSDRFYEITPGLEQIIRPESVGGTPANRMIHEESQQLFIGPYAVDAAGKVRVIPPGNMYGRLTGLARHLTDPAGKIVFATMEEGFYEVDVKSLAVTELWADEQQKNGRHADLPGYHGKGFYSAQGRYIYANNGDHAKEALTNPAVASGALAEWDGKRDKWTVVRRNQFTEVTGPGGITGGKPGDPVWSIGWDHRSLILMLCEKGAWQTFRLPKSSHSYDGAHGWNTEWPRIRDIGGPDLLMTMHGAFWKFPRTFSAANSGGIAPLSNYLKVIGDFCAWNGRVVMGGDIFPHFTGADTNGQAFAAFNIFPPGTGVPPHTHDLEDEAFYVQEGELEVLLGTEVSRLKAGQSAWLPRKILHAWTVVGDQPAKFLLVVTPAGLENLFRELAALPPGPPDAQTLDEISTRYGIKFL